MVKMKLIPASEKDRDVLADIFWSHITANREYISHGEIQMGVGVAVENGDGTLETSPAENGREMWLKYINEKLKSEDACVFKAETEDGETAGFCVADIEEDGAEPFGMVCDLLVRDSFRGQGTGGILLEKALEWLHGRGIKDIYLESGRDNHSAHEFFRKRGFVHISEIFKLKNK